MAAILPPLPRLVFTVLEPISLVVGFLGVVVPGPDWFINQQIEQSWLVAATDNGRLVALQLGNMYLLAAMVALAVLSATTEPKVVRNYLIALWLGDIGHIGLTAYGLGQQRLVAVGQWNAMCWGNIGITVFLFLMRTAYLLGLFGPDRVLTSPTAKKLA